MNDNLETLENSQSTGLGNSEVLDTGEETFSVLGENDAEVEYIVLQRMDATLQHIDSVLQYGVSLLIVFMLILVLHYIYKFFKMFF